MAEWIAGKTFRSEEEVLAEGGRVLSEEEKAAAINQFEEWDKNVRSKAGPGPAPVGGKFSDDMAGTEYDPEAPGYPDHMRKDPGR
ncbi:hypothetical protein [Nocardia testacea]|uniref:hypothetical protein n=1 Tax=Nocardia testacea TaxID=248551 RepID=UPI0033E9418E